jgi:hypothetical protein
MRRTDSHGRHHDAFFVVIVGLASTWAPRHEPESHHANRRKGEHAEGPASNWEAAWIDLGGEG